MKALTLVYGGLDRPPASELDRRERADEGPRVTLYEKTLNSDMLDMRDIENMPGPKGRLYRRLPGGLAEALEAFSRRKKYDVVVSWGERLGLPLAAILKATRSRTPHIALF